jgi:hypothetical protein
MPGKHAYPGCAGEDMGTQKDRHAEDGHSDDRHEDLPHTSAVAT